MRVAEILWVRRLAGCGKSDFGQLESAADHWISSRDPGITERDTMIQTSFVMAQNRFSAAC
jgi:hypothetical protein